MVILSESQLQQKAIRVYDANATYVHGQKPNSVENVSDGIRANYFANNGCLEGDNLVKGMTVQKWGMQGAKLVLEIRVLILELFDCFLFGFGFVCQVAVDVFEE